MTDLNKEQIFREALKSSHGLIDRGFIGRAVVADRTNTIKKYLNSYGILQLALYFRSLSPNNHSIGELNTKSPPKCDKYPYPGAEHLPKMPKVKLPKMPPIKWAEIDVNTAWQGTSTTTANYTVTTSHDPYGVAVPINPDEDIAAEVAAIAEEEEEYYEEEYEEGEENPYSL